MKYLRNMIAVLLICGILYWGILPRLLTVSASESQEDLIELYKEVLEISVFYQKESDSVIKCFDVNANGWYAIGYEGDIIQVYDDMGNFQYGYLFDAIGTYAISLKENNIVIYPGRSEHAIEIDPLGQCVDVKRVYSTKDGSEDVFYRKHKQIGNTTYCLERDIGIFDTGYSRLVKIDENGTKTILYDATTLGYFVGASHYLLLGLCLLIGIKAIRDKLNEEEQEEE